MTKQSLEAYRFKTHRAAARQANKLGSCDRHCFLADMSLCSRIEPTQDPSIGAALGSMRLVDRLPKIHNVVMIFCENQGFNNLFADSPGLERLLSGVPLERVVRGIATAA